VCKVATSATGNICGDWPLYDLLLAVSRLLVPWVNLSLLLWSRSNDGLHSMFTEYCAHKLSLLLWSRSNDRLTVLWVNLSLLVSLLPWSRSNDGLLVLWVKLSLLLSLLLWSRSNDVLLVL